MSFDYAEFREDLIVSEGYRLKPYDDTVGKLTIGCGRNLTDVGISDDEAGLMLQNDMERAVRAARDLVPSFDSLSDRRQRAIAEMAFNLGKKRLAGFRDMLAAIAAGNWTLAGDAAMASKWALQTGKRAQRIARALREG